MTPLEPTKPAGCALQLIGAVLFLGGLLVTMNGTIVAGVIPMGLGLWLLAIGRRPVTRGRQ